MASKERYYISDKPTRGMCIVINMQNYPEKSQYRDGSEADVRKLKEMFSDQLGFTFMCFTDLSESSLKKLLKSAAEMDCKEHQCFVLAILSHGERNSIQCSDGEFIAVHYITECFSSANSPTLARKPKIFIIQACRGKKENVLHPVLGTRGRARSDFAYARLPEYSDCVPKISDFIIIYPSGPGFAAFRCEDHGSFFIDSLLDAFNEYKDKGIELQTMLRRMNERSSRKCFAVKDSTVTQTQVSTSESNLMRDLYLPPIQWRHDLKALKQQNDIMTMRKLWGSIRRDTIAELGSIRQELQKVCQNVRKARISGGCVSAAGGVMAAVGFFLLPITFGGSLGLVIPGTALSIAGAGTAAGASAVDTYKMYRGGKIANAATAVDCQLSEAINEVHAAIKATGPTSGGSMEGGTTTNAGLAVMGGAQTAFAAGRTAAKGVAFGAAAVATKAAGAVAGGVMSLVTVPIDIISVGVSSHNLHKNKPAKVVELIDENIRQLDQDLAEYLQQTCRAGQ